MTTQQSTSVCWCGLVFVLFGLFVGSEGTDVSACNNFLIGNTYLTADIYTASSQCFYSNYGTVFDGQGHKIVYTGAPNSQANGFFSPSPVTIKNVTFVGFYRGVVLANDANVFNVTVIGNGPQSYVGITVGSNSVVKNCTVRDINGPIGASTTGIYASNSPVNITNNFVYNISGSTAVGISAAYVGNIRTSPAFIFDNYIRDVIALPDDCTNFFGSGIPAKGIEVYYSDSVVSGNYIDNIRGANQTNCPGKDVNGGAAVGIGMYANGNVVASNNIIKNYYSGYASRNYDTGVVIGIDVASYTGTSGLLGITIDNNYIDNGVGANGFSSPSRDAMGGHAYWIKISGGDYNRITNNVCKNLRAGNGGYNDYNPQLSLYAGNLYGVNLNTGRRLQVLANNTFSNAKAGTSGDGMYGRGPGWCFAIFIEGGWWSITGNTFSDIQGGTPLHGYGAGTGSAIRSYFDNIADVFNNTLIRIKDGNGSPTAISQSIVITSTAYTCNNTATALYGDTGFCWPPTGCCGGCVLQPKNDICRAALSNCDYDEKCDGISRECPVDKIAPQGTTCTTPTRLCEGTAKCSGVDGICPETPKLSASTICRSSRDLCDAPEMCTGTSYDCPDDVLYGVNYTCRPANGGCDIAENCTGLSDLCPPQQVQPQGVVCRAEKFGGCDVEELCDGTNATCPEDVVKPATTECRPSAGVCDIKEMCTGSSPLCPNNLFNSSTTVCRLTTDLCDSTEYCTGNSADCPSDGLEPNTFICRPSNGDCDVPDYCTGSDAECPNDELVEAGVVCRLATGVCDLNETCTGNSPVCPNDIFRPVSFLCRNATSFCDLDDYCSGSSANCKNEYKSAETICKPANGTCDLPDYCTGTSQLCIPSFKAASEKCRDSQGDCDVEEFCTGSAADCPQDTFFPPTKMCRAGSGCLGDAYCTTGNASCADNEFLPEGTICRSAIPNSCDVAETCSGNSGVCPEDIFRPSSYVCRNSVGVCDKPESCTGDSPICPPDELQISTTVCRNATSTCVAVYCTGTSSSCTNACVPPSTTGSTTSGTASTTKSSTTQSTLTSTTAKSTTSTTTKSTSTTTSATTSTTTTPTPIPKSTSTSTTSSSTSKPNTGSTTGITSSTTTTATTTQDTTRGSQIISAANNMKTGFKFLIIVFVSFLCNWVL